MIRSRLSRRLRRPAGRQPRTALTLERLEDRCVPATFTVTSLADSGAGSLRQAITDANRTAGNDTIRFQGAAARGVIDLLAPLPYLSTNVSLEGPGAADLTVRRSPQTAAPFGIFQVLSSAAVRISGLTLADGIASLQQPGGGVTNQGQLTISGCILSGNSFHPTLLGAGGIYNAGTLTVDHSTLVGNLGTNGGAIINGGTATITDSTLANNSATNEGGAIYNYTGTLTITNSTLAGNSAPSGGGLWVNSGTVTLNNTIVAANSSDLAGRVSGSHNLIGTGGSGGLRRGTDANLLGVADPGLGALQDNGGPTPTFALLPGSPAIDAGSSDLALDSQGQPLTTDQRGLARGAAVDIGAFELQDHVVDTLLDTTADDGRTSLREAITAANTEGSSQVHFGVRGGIVLTQGPLAIGAGVLQLVGAGADQLTVNGGHQGRVFEVGGGATAIFSGLSIVNGATPGDGGGIRNLGTLTLSDATLAGNRAGADGGGLANLGTLTLTNVRLTGNQADGSGGGLANSAGSTTLSNVTLTDNRADADADGSGQGGGLTNLAGTVSVKGSTVTGNYRGGGSRHDDVAGAVQASASTIGDPVTATGKTLLFSDGTPTSAVVASFQVADPDAYAGQYEAVINWGDGMYSFSPGTITANGTGFDVSGTHAYAAAGSYTIGVTITGPDRDMTRVESTAVVTARSLTAQAYGFLAVRGQPFSRKVASFTVSPGRVAADDFTAVVSWGDGQVSAGTIVPSPDGGDVLADHVYTFPSTNTVRVTVRDAAGHVATAGSQAVVASGILAATGKTLNVVETKAFTAVVASFQDADPQAYAGQYTATIDWGDGDTAHADFTPGTVTANGNGFEVSGDHTYVKAGTYPVRVQIQSQGQSAANVQSTAQVARLAIQPTGKRISVFGNKQFDGEVATFYDPDPRTDPTFYTAVITWDDGTTSPGTISDDNPFAVSGSHTFGSFTDTRTITVTITDKSGRPPVVVTSRVVDPPAPQAHQDYVGQLYQDLLGRPADDAGLAYWSALLDAGAAPGQVAQGLLDSPEYQTVEIKQLYTTLLHREADAAGLAYFQAVLTAGGTREQVEALILASPEYYQTRADGDDAEFLRALYHDLLHRAPDDTGLAVFGQALQQGVSRRAVAEAVFTSSEYSQKLASGWYGTYLFRDADEAGLQYFTDLLKAGRRDEEALAVLLASDEYATHGGPA